VEQELFTFPEHQCRGRTTIKKTNKKQTNKKQTNNNKKKPSKTRHTEIAGNKK
jgi:hypothetical protein